MLALISALWPRPLVLLPATLELVERQESYGRGQPIKAYITRHPLGFAVLLNLLVAGIAVAVDLALPSLSGEWRSSVADAVVLVLAAALLTRLAWWRQAGFNRPSEWRNLRLLWYPLLITAVSLAGGVQVNGAGALAAIVTSVLIGAFQEETIIRGLQWRALSPTGVMRAVVATTLLFASLHFLTMLWGASPAEATIAVIGTACAGLTYAALRFRTGTVWTPLLAHVAWNIATDMANPDMSSYLFVALNLATLGFLVYGLYLLRRQWWPGRREARPGTMVSA